MREKADPPLVKTLLILAALLSSAGASAEEDLCAQLFTALPRALRRQSGIDLMADTYARIQGIKNQSLPFVEVKEIGTVDGYPLLRVHVRSPNPAALKVFLSSGVHGQEPEGVTTGMSLLDEAVASPDFRRDYDLTYFPMVNPAGIRQFQRKNLAGIDINRSFDASGTSEASALLRDQITHGHFDLSVDLHGAWSKHQFFLIRAEEDPSLSHRILQQVPEDLLLPSSSGTYPGHAGAPADPKRYTLDSPGAARSVNAGTLKSFMAARGTPYSYTLEYPGQLDFPLQQMWNLRILREILRQVNAEKNSALSPSVR